MGYWLSSTGPKNSKASATDSCPRKACTPELKHPSALGSTWKASTAHSLRLLFLNVDYLGIAANCFGLLGFPGGCHGAMNCRKGAETSDDSQPAAAFNSNLQQLQGSAQHETTEQWSLEVGSIIFQNFIPIPGPDKYIYKRRPITSKHRQSFYILMGSRHRSEAR